LDNKSPVNPGKYIFIAILLILGFFCFKLIQPFLSYILLGLIFSVALNPIYSALSNKFKSKRAASIVTVLLVLLIIIIPTFFIVGSLVKQTTSFFGSINEESFTSFNNYLVEHLGPKADLTERLTGIVSTFQQFLLSSAFKIAGSVTDIVIGLFIMFSIMYYGFLQGEDRMQKISHIAPFSPERGYALINKIKNVTKAVIYGEVLIALAQGILGGLGFLIVGIGNPIFWGFLIAVFAFLPLLGSGMITIPAGIILIATNNALGGVFLLVYGLAVVGGIDYMLRPKIISGGSEIHPLTALIGVFGGLKLFGFTGIIIGPTIAALFVALVSFYYEDYLKANTKKKVLSDNKKKRNKKS